MKKAVSLILLVLLCMLLTGCYQNPDPWPASGRYTQVEDVTLAPRTTVTPVPTVLPTPEPTAVPVPDLWDDGPTEVPGGSIDPGFNG